MAANKTFFPVGYSWLAETFKVEAVPHFVDSCVATPGERRTVEKPDGRKREIYRHSEVQLTTVCDHLGFALKREGLHLELLRQVLPQVPAHEVAAYVRATPTGATARRLAYLWENFTGQTLDFPGMTMGNYVPLADPGIYYPGKDRRQSRWRINDNLIGTLHFSPLLRRTARLTEWHQEDWEKRCQEELNQYPASLYQRAISWLYAKETKSSYAIEKEEVDETRTSRFVALLRAAGEQDYLNEPELTALQKAIVDPRFASSRYRTTQNFVGQSLAPGLEEVHLIPPKPGEDLTFLMNAWAEMSCDLATLPHVPPVPAAAIVAYLFVFFHPFVDGNGRIHRFLIHHVLTRRKFGPDGIIFPVSAVMLNSPQAYDASLEAFSIPLKKLSRFTLSPLNEMVVNGETLAHFRYIDCTPMAEALCAFVAQTIDEELTKELDYLRSYDAARSAMREIVDLPRSHADLFIKLVRQNSGRLSQIKRTLPHFKDLTETEIADLEAAVSQAYTPSQSRGHGLPARLGAIVDIALPQFTDSFTIRQLAEVLSRAGIEMLNLSMTMQYLEKRGFVRKVADSGTGHQSLWEAVKHPS